MIAHEITDILSYLKFLFIATVSANGEPNVAPKLIIAVKKNCIYLGDFVVGKTWVNLNNNPHVSVSFLSTDNLTGYQIGGSVELLSEGPEYDEGMSKIKEQEAGFLADLIIDGIQKEKKHDDTELTFPERVVIYKVNIAEVVKICATGKLIREKQA